MRWTRARVAVAAVGALATAALIGLPTDVIPNPVFGRAVPVTWWSYPVLVVTALLSGLLLATYVREEASLRVLLTRPTPAPVGATNGPAGPGTEGPDGDLESVGGQGDQLTLDRGGWGGSVGGLLSLFAVGCPVCNKIVLLALGTSGALTWFAPVQPVLAVASIGALGWALRTRWTGARACPVPVTAQRP